MFGYIKVNKLELKLREYMEYKGYYCGICMSLKKEFGELSRLSLNYDTTFLQLVLSSLYEPENHIYKARCISHPHKKEIIIENEISKYSSAMNVILSYYKLEDDYNDDRSLGARLGMLGLGAAFKKAEKSYPEKAGAIKACLQRLYTLEKENCRDIDLVSNEFAKLMAVVFSYKEDEYKKKLEALGFNLGKYIYIVDAFEDRIEDRKNNKYNPFAKEEETKEFRDNIKGLLKFILSCVERDLDRLPILINLGIINNIVYSGLTKNIEKSWRENQNEEEEFWQEETHMKF